MLAYLDAHRGGRTAPPRAAIGPGGFADIVTQAFMVGAKDDAYPMRLVGGLLQDLHHGPLLGSSFVDLWADTDRPQIRSALEAAVHRGAPLVAYALGRSQEGLQTRIEMMLAPLAGPVGRVDRLLGFYQPVSPLFRLQNQRIERLFLQEVAFAGESDRPAASLRLAALHGRRIA